MINFPEIKKIASKICQTVSFYSGSTLTVSLL